MNRKTPTLKTMRANLEPFNMPKKLMMALSAWENYENYYTNGFIKRLVDGLKYMDIKTNIVPIAKNNGIDRMYVLKNQYEFNNLNGLFEFNKSDKMVSKILKKAWQLGYVPKN